MQAQQLHSELYVHLVEELQKAVVETSKQSVAGCAAEKQQQQAQAVDSTLSDACKLLQLAAECELAGDIQRGHRLHQRRLVLLPTAEVSLLGCHRASLSVRLG